MTTRRLLRPDDAHEAERRAILERLRAVDRRLHRIEARYRAIATAVEARRAADDEKALAS